MGFMDKLKDTAQKGMDAAQKGVGDAKDKASEYSAKRRFNSLAEGLGLLVFRQRSGESGLEQEIDELVDQMKELAEQLDGDDD